MSSESIIERIRALLAKANDAGCTEAEAAAAAAAVEKLLARHALSMLDVRDPGIVERKTSIRYLDPWTRVVAVHAARLYGCEPLVTQIPYTRPGRGKNAGRLEHDTYRSISVYGRPASAEVAVSMIDWLVQLVYRMSREYSSARREQLPFQRGAGERLATRLWEMHSAQRVDPEAVGAETQGTSLLVIEQSEARAWMEKNMRLVAVRNTVSNTGSDAAMDGWVAAGDVSLGGQVGRTGSAARALQDR